MFRRLAWQHAPLAAMLAELHVGAILRQQSCCRIGFMPSRQAEAGIAVQKTATASIINAPFLLQFMMYGSRTSIVILRRLISRGSDPCHMQAP